MKYHLLPDTQKGSTSPKSLRRRLQRQYYALPQWLRSLLLLAVTVIAVAAVTRHGQNERDQAFKSEPTDFTTLNAAHPDALWHPDHIIRHRNGTHIDDRYVFMRQLGKGSEGSAAVYLDVPTGKVVVVKTFHGILSNDIPGPLIPEFEDFGPKWPTEIEASLLLGNQTGVDGPAYVPVRDYFILKDESTDWHWALVTPYSEAGTLEDLAQSTKFHERTPQKLDKIFRSVFEVVLQNVGSLHTLGYCHDDIKPNNMLVANTTHWLLGDLGNVRDLAHPWHSTGKIKRENHWTDCKMNDVRRLLKTYMYFLREASGAASGFDGAFWKEEQAWSRLYWQWMQQPLAVNGTLELSRAMNSSEEMEWKAEGDAVEGACLRRKTDMELVTTTLRWRPTDFWPLRQC
ncbi:uncharacterized protein LTR77_002032 [Saxophila tyrrhenica]|uniref:Protein kinase domain-containing protein n=1 Tax=Saxophila tyrrhenica TaxID=1690608 RepID=A0AAV9PLZ9_9PEZI|nr:hypothetical protein LTR77_002032 [Saxophila tyrrhenica]